jgi:hypothetical protein
MANRFAKKFRKNEGVYFASGKNDIDQMQNETEIGDRDMEKSGTYDKHTCQKPIRPIQNSSSRSKFKCSIRMYR